MGEIVPGNLGPGWYVDICQRDRSLCKLDVRPNPIGFVHITWFAQQVLTRGIDMSIKVLLPLFLGTILNILVGRDGQSLIPTARVLDLTLGAKEIFGL